jgi:cytochrome P450
MAVVALATDLLRLVGQHPTEQTQVLIHVLAVNRSTELYGANADQFCPERWLAGGADTEQRTKAANDLYTYLTFGAGSRMCFGKKLVMLELKMILYLLLKEYELLDDSVPLTMVSQFGVKPPADMTIRFAPRN